MEKTNQAISAIQTEDWKVSKWNILGLCVLDVYYSAEKQTQFKHTTTF